MQVVEAPTILLEPHQHLVRECQAYAARHWQPQYGDTLLNAASYLQLLQDKTSRPLLESAISRTRKSLEKLINQPASTPPDEHYGCFSAALMLDVGLPLTNLAVYTETGAKPTRWNPLLQETIGEVGTTYDWKWIETPNSCPHHSVQSSRLKLLPETAAQVAKTEPGITSFLDPDAPGQAGKSDRENC